VGTRTKGLGEVSSGARQMVLKHYNTIREMDEGEEGDD